MKAIIKWTLWQRRWSTLWWSIGVSAFIFINLVFYPTFKNQAGDFDKTFQQLPETARKLFSDTGDFFSPVGFLSSQIFYLMLPMLLTILAIALGTALIGKEEKEGTIELLLSRPISRLRLMLGKVLSGVLIVCIVTAISGALTVGMCTIVDINVAILNVVWATFVAGQMAISFGAIAFAIVASGKVKSAAVGISSLVAIGGYIIVSLSGTVTWLKWPAKAFPFYYYHPSEILTGTYSWYNLIYFAILILACSVTSALLFKNRDLNG